MKIASRWILLGYFLILAYFGFRPFILIPGLLDARNGELRSVMALEDRKGSLILRRSLARTGRMSLEIFLKTDSLQQGGPARIVSFSKGTTSRNFTLGQSGNGLSFRLRTTETDGNGTRPSLLVPQVFDEQRFQHLALVYDGDQVRLYIDGMLHPTAVDLHGSFDNWGSDHHLVMGDELFGGRPWAGIVKRVSIYDRALAAEEIGLLHEGQAVPEAVYSYPGDMRPLRYRNEFRFTDPVFNARDCVANIVGFIPLAMLLWLVFPGCFRKTVCILVVPVMTGFLVSGMIEFAQRGISGRVPSLLDLGYNVFGAAIGSGVLRLGLKKRRR